MKKILLALLLLPLVTSAQQEDSTKRRDPKFVKIVSINAFGGGDFYRDGYEDRTMFQQAAPNSALPFADVSGYTNYSGGFYVYGRSAATAGLNVNLHLRCQKKFG